MYVELTKPAQGDPTRKEFADQLIDNMTDLNNRVIGLDASISNASFENDTDADGYPDGWVWTASGGTFTHETAEANVSHGAKAAKFTSAGAGGGQLESEDFFAVTDKRNYTFSWEMKSSIATVTNQVKIVYYEGDKVTVVSTVTLYSAASGNPTSYTRQIVKVTPPALARWAKLQIIGANSAVAGSTWYDDFHISADLQRTRTMQVFTATGTFTVPDYVSAVFVRVWGPGGGGGTSNGGGTVGGGGGGAGAYAEGKITVTAGGTLAITVGTGGAAGAAGSGNSVAGAITAGAGAAGATGASGGAGGAGGAPVATSSTVNSINGGDGFQNNGANGGRGGTSPGGGSGGREAVGVVGIAGISPGGGGSGGGGAATAGGAGADGRVIVEY